MDLIKKRKLDKNGVVTAGLDNKLSVDDVRKILEPFTPNQLLEIVASAAVHHFDVLAAVRSIADSDVSQRKLFIRGLGFETTTENLRNVFASYGELAEAIVIHDKATGKSKGYGFVTFKHLDGALLALKEPNKNIDGRMTVAQLASAGNTTGPTANSQVVGPVESRKVYVGNVPQDMPAERLFAHFSSYGEVEGPLGFDKETGKSKGYALFVYRTAEAAKASLVDPIKTIDGHQLICKFANEGKKAAKPGAPGGQPVAAVGQAPGQVQASPAVDLEQQPHAGWHGLNQVGSAPGGFGPQFGGGLAGGISTYGGFSGGLHGQNPMLHSHPGNFNSSLGGAPGLSSLGGGLGTGLSSLGSQVSTSLGGGGFSSGLGVPYGGPGSNYGGLGGGIGGLGGAPSVGLDGGLGGLGGAPSVGLGGGIGGLGGAPFGGLGGIEGGMGGRAGIGLGGSGRGSLYGLPSGGSGGHPESAHYSLSSGSVYQSQQHQTTGNSPLTRVPPGGMYQGHSMPPYY